MLRRTGVLLAFCPLVACDDFWAPFLRYRCSDTEPAACLTDPACNGSTQVGEPAAVQPSGTANTLNGIWGVGDKNIWAVGAASTILHYDGTTWTTQHSGSTTDPSLNAIWGNSTGSLWAVGSSGAIFQYAGTSWSPVDKSVPPGVALYGISGTDDGAQVFAVGSAGNLGTIVRWTSTTAASTQTTPQAQVLNGIWGNSTEGFWAVGAASGGSGVVLHSKDGSGAWTQLDVPATGSLNGIAGSSGHDIWVGGFTGTLLHYDGQTWNAQAQSGITMATLFGIWGSGGTLWAVGQRLAILNRNSGCWSAKAASTVSLSTLKAVWGGAESAWAAGEAGLILKIER